MSKEKDFIDHRKANDTSSVWYHYLTSIDGKSAKCKKCSAVLKTLGGSTKGLHTHLLTKHNTKILKEISPSVLASTSQEHREDTAPSKKRKIQDYFASNNDSLDLILSRMTAKDGIAFRIFVTSIDLRKLLIAKGYSDLPTSAQAIRNRVMNFSLKIRDLITEEIQDCKCSGKRFSLTFDEWTSTANKRFMNVNVHSRLLTSTRFWNLGLIRIRGSMTAIKCIEILTERLNQHGISLKTDIVAIITDGPNIMVKVGKEIEAEHQLCFAHGIHLAICDILYKKRNTQHETFSEKPMIEPCYETENSELSDDEDCESVENFESGFDLTSEDKLSVQKFPYSEEDMNELVKKVRKLVIYFKRSPTKNAVLQTYVKSEKGKEFSLLLDCKTRWNSLLIMLERFVLLKNSIQKALIDLKPACSVDESDFLLMNEIVDVLKPIHLTVEALCRRDSNLLTADAALKFLLKELSEKESIFAHKMTDAIKQRIQQRRRIELSGIVNYLHNPKRDDLNLENSAIDNLFSMPNKTVIRKHIKSMIDRLNNNQEDTKEHREIQLSTTTETEQDADKTYKDKLQEEIEKSMVTREPATKKQTDLLTIIKNEMRIFESGGVRGHHLELAYQYLLTISPTSVEAERAFSAAGFIGNKIRSRLGDDTLDALLFLRSYFQNSTP